MSVERLAGWLVPFWNAAFTLVPCCLQILRLLDSQRGYLVVLRLPCSFSPSLITSAVCLYCLCVWCCYVFIVGSLNIVYIFSSFYKKKCFEYKKRRKVSPDQTVTIAPFYSFISLLMSLPRNNIQSDKDQSFHCSMLLHGATITGAPQESKH